MNLLNFYLSLKEKKNYGLKLEGKERIFFRENFKVGVLCTEEISAQKNCISRDFFSLTSHCLERFVTLQVHNGWQLSAPKRVDFL